jgi:hypothetical protein
MDTTCKGFTKKGEKCKNKAKFGDYCGIHKEPKVPKTPKAPKEPKVPKVPKEQKAPKPPKEPKAPKPPKEPKRNFDGLDLPRIPVNLKEKLANASDIGLKKIKEQIIQMWLEDGGSYLTLEKYKNRIPVAPDVYKLLLQEFNGEEFVMNQIFIDVSSEPKEDKETPVYGSSRAPLVPITLTYYTDFIPKGKFSKILNSEQQESFNKLKNFIFKKWKELGEIIQYNKIYLESKTYEGAKIFFKNKLLEVSTIYDINIDFWTEFIMTNIFSIGIKNPNESKNQKESHSNESKIPKQPKINIPKSSNKKKRNILMENAEKELINLFPNKDVKVYIEIITKNTNDYVIKSNADIYKLYKEFHPDKCSSDPKIVKLCNLFCGRVENIKKLWAYRKSPKTASPVSGKLHETEILLRILNEEI